MPVKLESDDTDQDVYPRAGALILVVDDGALQVRLTQICLEKAGYQVVSTPDGQEALEIAKSRRPALVLLDVEMPGMNGFQVLDRLRRDPQTEDIPVVMLTAHAKDEPLFAEMASAGDAFVAKPCPPDDLVATVQRVLGDERRTS